MVLVMKNAADNAAKQQRGRPFGKGVSGNPAGRPPGLRNKATRAAEALLDGEAETITRKAIEHAKGGDPWAIRLCLERILPARRDRPLDFQLPSIETAADAATASSALVAAVAAGELTPTEAAELGKLLESYVRALESTNFEQRLVELEKKANEGS
jgi:Family of unknown function (DUF5681)